MELGARDAKGLQFLFILVILIGLYFTTFVNYLLFHSLVEGFSIIVAFSFFAVTWNSKNYIKNKYILFIGIAYFFIASLDLLHTLSYKGMPIFTGYDFYANQLWIGARYMESLTLLTAFYTLGEKKVFEPEAIFLFYSVITTLLVLSIFVWKIFPVCFIEGSGLTFFKKISEYIISAILISCIVLLNKKRTFFEPNIFRMLVISLIFTIISELAFTFYISNYGISNLVGHYFKLFSFYLIYKAVIETGLCNPYDLIFWELDSANKKLTVEIDARIKSEKKREKLIGELKTALSHVKTLSGLLPICSHCKKIRDDKGYWNQLESYLNEHSQITLSHGICPECSDSLYGNEDWYIEMKKSKKD
jgi:hypothetical protein